MYDARRHQSVRPPALTTDWWQLAGWLSAHDEVLAPQLSAALPWHSAHPAGRSAYTRSREGAPPRRAAPSTPAVGTVGGVAAPSPLASRSPPLHELGDVDRGRLGSCAESRCDYRQTR